MFRGSTDACLRHLGTQAEQDPAVVQELAGFTGADAHNTVPSWLAGKHMPEGEYLLRVRFFLAEHGYSVAEINKLHSVVRNVGLLIAHRAIGFDAAVQELNFSGRDKLFLSLNGKHRPNRRKRAAMAFLWETHRHKLNGLPAPAPTKATGADQLITINGTTVECFRHYAGGMSAADIKALERATGADQTTVYEWRTGKHFPKGLYLLKLRCYLADRGYGVTEWQALPGEIRTLARLISYGALTVSASARRLNISADHLLTLLRKTTKPTPGILEPLRVLLEEHRTTLELLPSFTVASPPGTAKPQLPSPASSELDAATSHRAVDAFIMHLQAIQPIAVYLLKDDDPALRRRLRDLGRALLFDVSTMLNRLCSEKARKLGDE